MAAQMSTITPSTPVSLISIPFAGGSQGQHLPAWASLAVRQLSSREREILPLLAARWTDREIADVLCISYRTVTTHVTHIFDKLGIDSRREVTPFAMIAEGELE